MSNNNYLLDRLKELNEIGIALSWERDIGKLLELILDAAKRFARADAGTLYLFEPETQTLRFEILRNDTLNTNLGGSSGQPIKFPPIRMYDETGAPVHSMVVTHAALTGETVNIADAYDEKKFDFSGTRKFDASTGYRSKSFLTVPMHNHEGDLVGVLQLINAVAPGTGEIVAFSQDDQHMLESLASQAGIALSNRQLVQQMEKLFESLVMLINTAIDEKSPYTAGHCERVPELTMLLAEAVNRTNDGPLKDFHMSDRDRYELHIAGLLHDCGKISTPVHVVDKATKLQTIFDRIHLLDTRFEVIKRDAEIAMLRGIAAGGDAAALRSAYEAQAVQIDADRDFLRHSNIGKEKMSDEDILRVQDMAKRYRWHDVNGSETDFLSAEEVENLTIRAGTLTAEERGIINRHIDVTIKMLQALPWPKHLKNVPEYAGGHHERMDGKGYPLGLTREQMSVQARCMGIADIFEALTAKDRPYKKGMKLSEALFILGKFKENGHIDPDLFDVFIREKVYLSYARQFMTPEQIDEVDLGKVPGCPPI
ncbi:MAG: GAF domain-containing protein [Gallionella sp.]|nr:GAF domain-containing protein [Gallionella sp.]